MHHDADSVSGSFSEVAGPKELKRNTVLSIYRGSTYRDTVAICSPNTETKSSEKDDDQPGEKIFRKFRKQDPSAG